MALINLPNHTEETPIQWNTELDIYSQSAEAQEYAYGLIEAGENATLTEEEYCMQDYADNAMNRPTKKVYEDIPNNLKLEEVLQYVNLANSPACMAQKGRIYTMIETV